MHACIETNPSVGTGLSGEIVLRSLYWLSLHNPALWAVSGAGKVHLVDNPLSHQPAL